jgi:D-tyrosyl-tRNA(Tyr) deacylase
VGHRAVTLRKSGDKAQGKEVRLSDYASPNLKRRIFQMFNVNEAKQRRANIKAEYAQILVRTKGNPENSDFNKANQLFAEAAEIDAALAQHEAGAVLAAPGTHIPGLVLSSMEHGISRKARRFLSLPKVSPSLTTCRKPARHPTSPLVS